MSFLNKKSSMLLSMSILAGIAAFSPLNLTYAAEAAANDTAAVDAGQTREVVVTATRTEAEVKTVPNAVEVITSEDIQKLGAADIYQALKLATNIDVRPQTAGHNVSIRGTNSNDNLILINGQRTADEDTNETQNIYALDRVPLSSIERIEIVRGAASAQYGSDAIGGVINIITKKSGGTPSVTVGVNTGTESMSNYYHIDLGKQGKFSGVLDAKFSKYRKNLVGDGPQTYYYGPRQNFNFAGTYDLDENNHLNFNIGYYNEHSDVNLGTDYAAFGPGFENGYVKAKKYDYSIGLEGNGDNSNYMFRTYYSKLKKERSDVSLSMSMSGGRPTVSFIPAVNENTFTLWGVEGKNSVQVSDKHLLTYGAEYRKNKVEGNNLGTDGNSKNINSYGLYLQDEWMVNDKLLLIPSVRYDHFTDFGSKTTPKIGATYFLNDSSRIKANWGKGFKAPSLTELYGSISHFGMFDIVGNPDLKAEESNNWDISYEAEKGKTSGKITYFHNDVENLINWHKISSSVYGYENLDEATLKGVELELKQKLDDKWSLRATSNWLNAKDNEGSNLEGRADNISRFEIAYDDGNSYGINAILWNEWVTGMHGAGGHGASEDVMNQYTYNTTNFVVNKKLGEGNRIYAGVDNIFDKKISDIDLEGRLWRVGAEWTF